MLVAYGALTSSRATADAQISVRLANGGGASIVEHGADEAIWEVAVRGEALFGPAAPGYVRFGPAIELRTDDYVTAEAAGGVALSLPIVESMPLVVTAGAGWASRPGDADGPVGVGVIAWGYRSYDYAGAYAFGLELYAAAHVDLADAGIWQITGGVEIDLELIVVVPALLLWNLLSAGDPDEPGP